MPPLVAAIPAITAITGLASAGAGVAGALAQGGNKGTQALAPEVGKMDPNAFQYGGGIQSPEIAAAQQAAAQAEAAHAAVVAEQTKWGKLVERAEYIERMPPSRRTPADMKIVANKAKYEAELIKAESRTQESLVGVNKARAAAKGGPSLAESEANRLGGLADAARSDQGPQVDLTNYNQTRGQAQAARGAELEALGLSRDAAMGNAPSAAQATLQRGVDAANQGAASMAASARGGGGNLALAGLQAGQQQATNAAAAGQEASILRANEMAQARQAFSDAAIRQRANELQAQGLDEKTAMDQAANEQATKTRNAATGVAYEGLKSGVYGSQQSGKQAFQTGQAANDINVATGNRTAQDKGFENTQHAISTAFTAGGQALDGTLGAVKTYYPPKNAPATTGTAAPAAPAVKPAAAAGKGRDL
jgi:hypothetical protein